MPIYESENKTRENLERIRKTNVCAVCGAILNIYLDRDTGKVYVACWDYLRTHHEGIIREASSYEQKGLEALNIKSRREIMNKQFGEEKTTALEKYMGVTSLTRDQATEIMQQVYPKAPELEMKRAVLLCVSYSLNPLMGHVFLIPFKGKEGVSWVTVLGIKAKRLLASRRRPISYVDDTPRLMSEEEQRKIYGRVFNDYICAITVLKDPATGASTRGYGRWLKTENVYGVEKGNSAENMAFIRSESQALDRLCPGEMPVGVEVIDEQYAKEPIIEGEFAESKEDKKQPAKKKPEVKEPAAAQEAPAEATSPISPQAPKGKLPTTADELYERIALAKGWKNTTYCRSFIIKTFPTIEEEHIDKEPGKVWGEIAPLLPGV